MYLTDLSPRDARWREVKPQSRIVANVYAGTVYERYSERIQDCGGWLHFDLVATETDELIHKLQSARLCHVRHCPICQWRYSLMWRSRIFRAIPRILTDYPGKQFLYLTLTARNCKLDKLGAMLTHMNESWQRLSQRKQFPALGSLRSVEVTPAFDVYYGDEYLGRHGKTWVEKWVTTQKKGSRSFDESEMKLEYTDEAHPHFHALLMVNANYFTKEYLSHENWVKMWGESLRVDYPPIVHINRVRLGNHSSADTSESADNSNAVVKPIDEGLAKAIRYTLKYSCKPDDFLSPDTSVSQDNRESQIDEGYAEWLLGITKQLHKRRGVIPGGIFKKYISEADPTNLIVDEEAPDTGEVKDVRTEAIYVWRDELTNYLLTA